MSNKIIITGVSHDASDFYRDSDGNVSGARVTIDLLLPEHEDTLDMIHKSLLLLEIEVRDKFKEKTK